jgi:hypothetical protein
MSKVALVSGCGRDQRVSFGLIRGFVIDIADVLW